MTPLLRQIHLRAIASAIGLAGMLHGVAAMAQVPLAGRIACIPERPIVHADEEIAVSAFVLAPAGARLEYAWKATTGQISGAGKQVKWSLEGALSGIHTSTVTVTSAGTRLGDCS